MKSGPHTFARLIAWSVLLLGLSVGCGSGCGSDPNPPPEQREMPDADASLVEASKSQGIRANGKDVVDIKVTVRKANGTALAGRTVKVTVSGEAVTVVQPAGPTDAQGVAIAKVTSTVAGTRTVTASVEAQGGPVTLTSRPTLEFVVLPASKLAFTTAPRLGTAGEALGVFEVSIQDADGETMAAATNTVTVAMGSGPTAASLKGTLSVAAVNGVARFSTLMLERAAQGYTLTASASGLSSATSPAFDVTSAAPASLVLAQVPATVTAGSALSPEVSVLDAFSNVVTGYTGTVHFSSDDAAASLPSDYTFTSADAGRHVFTGGLVLKRAGARRVAVTDSTQSTLTAASEVGVVSASAAAILFTEQPGNHSVRSPFGARVALLDAFGNRVTASGVVVTLGLGESGPMEGIAPATTVEGVASFSGISIARDAVGYVLTASADGLLSGSSAPFTITDDVPPASPVLEEQATTATTITVTWRTVGDDGLLGEASRYDLRYSASPIASDSDFERATVVKQVTVPRPPNVVDSANISGLTPNTTYYVALEVKDNAGNTVRVTRPVSTPYPTASKLALLDQPSNKTAGSTQAPLRVAIQDQDGLLVTNATSVVTLTVQGVTGFGPFIATAENGVATFSDVRIDTAGRGYTLKATSGSLTPDTSNPFDIQHAPASRLALTEVASKVSSGTPTRARVAVVDAYGNVAEDYTGTVALSSSDMAASLPAAHAFIATDKGRFTFENITLLTAGMQTLTASAAGLTAGTAELEVLPRKLLLTDLPATLKAGDSAMVMVEVLDGFGVRDTGYTGTVRFTSSDSKATLPSEYTFAAADLGLKAFNVRFVSLGDQTLTVRDMAMATLSATASTRVKWGDAVKLVLEAPEAVVAGNEFSARVTVLDGFGYTVEDYGGTVSFSSFEPGSTLPGVYSFTLADKGSRAFSFKLERAVSTELAVMDVALALNATDTVAVSHAPASRLVLAVVPTLTAPVTAGSGLTVEVTAKDAYGNVATGYAGTVRLESSDAQAVLPADASFAGAGGRKSFPVTLKTAGEQSVSAKDTVAPLLSERALVQIVPGPVSKLAFRAPPTGGKVRVVLAPVTVAITDLYGNTVSVDAPALTVGLVDGNPDALLGGTLTVSPSGGVATFSSLTVDQQGVGFRLEVMGGSFDALSSGTFGIEDDLVPEAPTLSWANKTSTQLKVQWTAVADDGLLGPAAVSHELRYSTNPITEATFATAKLVDAGWPQSPGAQESVLIQGLTPSTTYYFALKVMDDAGNPSVLSTLSTATNADPCAGYMCPVSASFCAADGVTRTSYTATCVDVNNAPSCGETSMTALCPGADGVCFKGACGTAPKPGAGSLSISEVMHSPSSGTTEYIELTNNTGNLLNLNGLSLAYTLGSGTAAGSVTVGSGSVPVVVEAKGTFVLAQNKDLATNGGVSANVAYDAEITLEDSGTIKLTQGFTMVEFFSYTTDFPRTSGKSMNLSSLVVGTKANAHTWYWCDSSAQLPGGSDFGTPNAPNSDCGIVPAAPVDSCAIQNPKTFPSGDGSYPATVAPGSSWTIYSQFREPGLTDRNKTGNDNYPHVVAELGYGTDSTNPAGWTWTSAVPNLGYNTSFSDNDEVLATLRIPTFGTYSYGFRYRFRDPFTGEYSAYAYCDRDGVTVPPAGSYGQVVVTEPLLAKDVVISEFAVAGPNGAADEFIELYNPTSVEVDISGWKLQYKGATSLAYNMTPYSFPAGTKIAPRGYFLVTASSYSGSATRPGDASLTLNMSGTAGHVRLGRAGIGTGKTDALAVDTVGYGSGVDSAETAPVTTLPTTSGSFERKAHSASTPATMQGGVDATRGNGLDSNNNASDFVVRTTRQPQNASSGTESL